MAANPREARRRRILERGSDRLALITGQIQSLPSPSTYPPPHDESNDSSSQPLISNHQDLRPRIPDQPTAFAQFHATRSVSLDRDKPVVSTLQRKDPQITARSSSAHYGTSTAPLLSKSNEIETSDKPVVSTLQRKDPQITARSSSAHYGSSTAPLLSKSNEIETAVASTPEDGGRAPFRVTPSEGQVSSLSTLGRDQCSKPKLPLLSSFSLNELSLAISGSEKTRLCSTAIIAFLVVASYVGFPFLGQSLMRILFGSRPLYLVLLTNVTVVLGKLLFTKKKHFRRVPDRGEGQVIPPEGQSSIEQIGKILEAGIVAQKAMSAIFMDCSVFSVIVVSGLSFVQRL